MNPCLSCLLALQTSWQVSKSYERVGETSWGLRTFTLILIRFCIHDSNEKCHGFLSLLSLSIILWFITHSDFFDRLYSKNDMHKLIAVRHRSILLSNLSLLITSLWCIFHIQISHLITFVALISYELDYIKNCFNGRTLP